MRRTVLAVALVLGVGAASAQAADVDEQPQARSEVLTHHVAGSPLAASGGVARVRLVQSLTDRPTVPGPAAVDFAENRDDAVAAYTAVNLADDPIVWSVSGDDSTAFTIAGGVLKFLAVPDHEKPSDADADNVYEVTVTATDASLVSASIDVAVTVTDVDDPSIVVIMADEGGEEVYGAYGSAQYDTPRLDAIAASGVRFDNAFSKPWSTPSRVAIMTGKSNVRNYADRATLLRHEYTFADLFSEAGYATAIAGKWQLQGVLEHPHIASSAGRGFDTYCLWHTTLTRNNATSRYWNPVVECDDSLIDTDATDYGPDIFVNFLLDFIETNQHRPFFAYYPMALPHHPFHLPPAASCGSDDSDQCRFEKMVARIDHNVGRIYDKLEALGLLDNTLLLFTADNASPASIVSYLDGAAIYGDKRMPTDGGTRVPLIVHVPGETAGRVVDDLIDITDILPTVAEAAGVEIPAAQVLDGVSFWDQLQGDEGTPREWIYTYYFPDPHRARFDSPRSHPEIAYVRGLQYKLYSTGELFDVTADPFELHGLPEDDVDSAAARIRLQAVLDSMPTRGERIAKNLTGVVPDGLHRPLVRPLLSSAEVNGDELTLFYAGTVRTSPAPPTGSFTVSVDGTVVDASAVEVAPVGVGASAVTLTLETEVVAGQDVAVSYVPGSNSLRHVNRTLGHFAAPLSGVAVANVTPPNDPPTITGPSSLDYAEAGSGIVAAYNASDPQEDPVSWSLSGVDAERFDVGSDGALTFETSPDFESPADDDLDNVYAVTVVASDGRLSATHDVSVTVANEDEPGRVDLSSLHPQAGVALSASLADPDSVVNESWSWQRSADLNDWSVIDGETASSYTPVEADVDNWLRALAVYEDGHGAGKQRHRVSDSRTRAAPVTNGAPQFVSSSVERSVAENSEAGTAVGAPVTATDPDTDPLTYSLSGRDADSFEVDESTGQITVGAGASLDHETRASYAVTVTAADPPGLTASASVMITVADRNEAPIAADDAALTDEDRSVVIAVLANDTDPEGDLLTVSLRRPPADGTAAVNPDRTVTYAPAADFHGSDSFTYRVSDGSSTSTATVTVTVAPINDTPEFTGGPLTRTVSNGSPAGADVGMPVVASDRDGDQLAYLLEGTDAVHFDIDETSGQILVGDDPGLVERQMYSVTVAAVDPDESSAFVDVTITTSSGRRSTPGGGGGGGAGGGGAGGEGSEETDVPEVLEPAGFEDVDAGDVHASNIDALYAAGIAEGCSLEPRRFCPADAVTRAQMASLLARALELRTPARRVGFADVDPRSARAAAIEALFAAGITVGCSSEPLRYCPDEPVSRAEMASFLVRALELAAPRQPAGFADVDPSSVHGPTIDALFAAGITVGCSSEPLRYCPDEPVSRAEMVSFLVRALSSLERG